jgi:hypothetical protein
MKIVPFLLQRRRILALCAATIVLHYLALAWVGTGVVALPAKPPPNRVVSVQLRAAPLPAPTPVQVSAQVKLPVPVPSRTPVPDAIVAAGVAAGPGTQSFAAAPKPAAVPAPEFATLPAPESSPAPESVPVQAALPPDASDTGRPPHVYRVDLPPSAELEMEIMRTDADGTMWNGAGLLSWQRDGSYYKTTLEAGLDMLVTRVNLLVITSTGQIDDDGIAPVTTTEKRKGRSLTATHFDRNQGRITFSASTRSYALWPGAQDKATLPFQLAGIGRADVNQFRGDIDLLVGEDKEANVFRFNLISEDELDTKMGRLLTWHLSRPPKPGTYSSQLDIWLAPGLGWYPVRIRNTEANGAVTTQSVSRITAPAVPGT